MYIGPWQEYKLARLIQASHEKKDIASRIPSGLPRQSSIDRLHNGGCSDSLDRLETSSVSSSTRSGLSSRSAPPRLRVTPQSRLNDMFQDAGHARRGSTPSSASSSAGRPPRPSSSTGARRGAGGRQPAARRTAASKSAAVPKASPEAERRARIAHMQRLYGLGASSPKNVEPHGSVLDLSPPLANATVAQAAVPAPPAGIANPADSTSARGGLPQEQMPMLRPPVATTMSLASVPCEEVINPLASNPLNVTTNGTDEEDLIAWSKMLMPESVSAEADLACLLPPLDL